VPHGILQVCIIILYVFQNPELFPTQVSLYPQKSTLAVYSLSSAELVSS
jgi:hypothetical protein